MVHPLKHVMLELEEVVTDCMVCTNTDLILHLELLLKVSALLLSLKTHQLKCPPLRTPTQSYMRSETNLQDKVS